MLQQQQQQQQQQTQRVAVELLLRSTKTGFDSGSKGGGSVI
jgi:hypothetical protein